MSYGINKNKNKKKKETYINIKTILVEKIQTEHPSKKKGNSDSDYGGFLVAAV